MYHKGPSCQETMLRVKQSNIKSKGSGASLPGSNPFSTCNYLCDIGKSLSLCVPQFPHLENVDCENSIKLIHVKSLEQCLVYSEWSIYVS